MRCHAKNLNISRNRCPEKSACILALDALVHGIPGWAGRSFDPSAEVIVECMKM